LSCYRYSWAHKSVQFAFVGSSRLGYLRGVSFI
jgi:hypothetical protein